MSAGEISPNRDNAVDIVLIHSEVERSAGPGPAKSEGQRGSGPQIEIALRLRAHCSPSEGSRSRGVAATSVLYCNANGFGARLVSRTGPPCRAMIDSVGGSLVSDASREPAAPVPREKFIPLRKSD